MHKFTQSLRKASDHPLITGTLILTLTGLITRFIGFFYRIYLSRLFGEEGMGIYQLISPVTSLTFSLFAAGFQTAISKLSAEAVAKAPSPYHESTRRPLWVALSISLPLSGLATLLTYLSADFIAGSLLREVRTTALIRIIAFSFPFVSVHACINGWFYGMKKASVPSLSQLLEQLTRVGCVFLVTRRDLLMGRTPTISTAILGLALGELVSMIVTIVALFPYCRGPLDHTGDVSLSPMRHQGMLATSYWSLLSLALPLTANRLVLNLLGSVESVTIPEKLRAYGYDTQTALSVFGVLTGMAMPLIFFPNALTGSMAVMLLPMISENYCLRKWKALKALTLQTLKYSLLMGLLCMLGFVLLGPWIGTNIFHSALAGRFIRTLGFICPFLYLDTTLSSILQGLGKAGALFFINVLCLLVRLGFVLWVVPFHGITGYLWGMLAGQLLLSLLYLGCLISLFRRHEKA